MLAAVALLALAAVTPAQRREARALLLRSLQEYEILQFEAALADIQQAYLLDPQPELLYNVGQCERALHHWAPAKFAFERYLRERPQAVNRARVEKLIADVEARQRDEADASARAKAAAAPPPPVQTIVVEAPSPPAPPAAVEAAPPPAKPRSHALAWTLGSIGVAAGVVAGFGAYEVASYDSEASLANRSAAGTVNARSLTQYDAPLWQPLSIGLAAVAVAGLTAAGFTW